MTELERILKVVPQSEHSLIIETHSPEVGIVLPTIRVCAFDHAMEIEVIDLGGVKHIIVIRQSGDIEVDA
jgi:hypothetical protein